MCNFLMMVRFVISENSLGNSTNITKYKSPCVFHNLLVGGTRCTTLSPLGADVIFTVPTKLKTLSLNRVRVRSLTLPVLINTHSPPSSPLFTTIHHYSPLFTTIHHYSPLTHHYSPLLAPILFSSLTPLIHSKPHKPHILLIGLNLWSQMFSQIGS